MTVIESNSSRTVVRFDIGSFSKDAVEINGLTYYSIGSPDQSVMLNAGEPALPRICKSIIIPDDAMMRLNIVDSKFVDFPNTPVIPSKGNLLRSVNPEDIPYRFGPVYSGMDSYPSNLASLRDPYILRDYRGAVVEINPFQYDPAEQTLRVFTSITVEILADVPGQVNVLQPRLHAGRLVPDFDLIYKRRFLNYPQAQKYTPVIESGDMLIITYDAFHADMLPLVNWNMQKGIKTTIVDVSSIGNNASSIASYIQNFYDSTNLAWIILVDYLFNQGATPVEPAACDVDGSTAVDVADLTFIVDYLFRGGPPPTCGR